MNVFAKLLMGLILLLSVSVASAQNVDGVLKVVKGDVQIKSAKTGQTVKARIGEKVFPKDVIITGKDARAKIVMVDNNEINVSPESQIEIQHYEFDPNAGKKEVLLNVIYGKVRAKVEQKYDGKTSKFQVKTPSAVAGVRGTDFMTSYNKVDNSSQVVTFRGAVEFGLPGPGGKILNPVSVTPGKAATSVAGAPPSAPTNMPKGELAKMDNETKADGPAAGGPGAKSDRAPSNDKGDKGDVTKPTANDGAGCKTDCGPTPPPPPGANVAPQIIQPPPPPYKPPEIKGNTNVNVHIK
ncbi:MAG: FecR family protein [Bdellovibrionales bacterium]